MTTPIKKQSGFTFENLVFYISILFLITVVGSFFYLRYLISDAESQLAEFSSQMAKAKTEEQRKLENYVLTTQQKLEDFSAALYERKSTVVFLRNFEGLVLPEIYFSKCELDFSEMAAKLSGHAINFKSLGQQINLFRSADNMMGNVELEKIMINEKGGIDFDVKFGIKTQMAAM